MNRYQFESVINENGMIVLPNEMKSLRQHRIRLMILDLEAENSDPVYFLDYITRKFADTGEVDLNLSEIYTGRTDADERRIMFD